MAEAENIDTDSAGSSGGTNVVVVVPVFPVLPGLRESLATLAAQTQPPELVVLLDDGSNAAASSLPAIIPSLHCEIVQVEPCTVPAAINAMADYLVHFDFVGLLLAGDGYAPTRIARCLEAFESSDNLRPPAMVVTGLELVDSHGCLLPDDDPRVVHFDRLWAPGRGGSGLADWLGAGHFTGTASNLFMRRQHLAENPLIESTTFAHAAAMAAGVQGLLTIVHEPLLRHYPAAVDREPTMRVMTEVLNAELSSLLAMSERLEVSPETRRNLAAYHRSAWNSLSAVREDLFQQILLRLASTVPEKDARAALMEILRSVEAPTLPAHWAALQDSETTLDLAAYADALRRTRDKLEAAMEENTRLKAIADAAQGSGWVRFGAWLGERSSRCIMELEEKPDEAEASESDSAPHALRARNNPQAGEV